MKSPLEFSQPHSPVLGSWMQPVPKPSSLPLPLQKKKKKISNQESHVDDLYPGRGAHSLPEESPAAVAGAQLGFGRGLAGVRLARAVGDAVRVGLGAGPDGEGLAAGDASVVGALGGLNVVGRLLGRAGRALGHHVLGVGRARVEGGRDGGGGREEGGEGGEAHFDWVFIFLSR